LLRCDKIEVPRDVRQMLAGHEGEVYWKCLRSKHVILTCHRGGRSSWLGVVMKVEVDLSQGRLVDDHVV
jgi:hypothetical protein